MEPQAASAAPAELGSPRAVPWASQGPRTAPSPEPRRVLSPQRTATALLPSSRPASRYFVPPLSYSLERDKMPSLDRGGGLRCPQSASLLQDLPPQGGLDPDLGMCSGLGLATCPPTARVIQQDLDQLAPEPPVCRDAASCSVRELSERFYSPESLGPREREKPPVGTEIGLPSRAICEEEPPCQGPVGLVIEPPTYVFSSKPEEPPKLPKILEPGVEPPDTIRPIYLGKFFDRHPKWPTAGKLIPVGYRAGTCLTEQWPPPLTPPHVKKFYKFRYPDPGTERVFYGRAYDPEISHLTHGKKSDKSLKADPLINPPLITTFQQKVKEMKESIYSSKRKAPLGKSHDQTLNLPEYIDLVNTTFGDPVLRDIPGGEVVNPRKSYAQVDKEANQGHDLYIVSHNDYFAGEMKNRKYNPESFSRFQTYGVETPHFNDGRQTAKCLHWLHELQMKKGHKIVSKRVDDFNEKFQHKLGQVWDPIAETMNVPPNHTFGIVLHPDECGAADLMYSRHPGTFRHGKDRLRAVFETVRQQLKKVNYHNFDTLLQAFRHFDRNGDGFIDKQELQRACIQMNLELDEELLNELFNYCDLDKDGRINYLEFTNFLNWKDKMPIKEVEEKILLRGIKKSEDSEYPHTTGTELEGQRVPLIKPEDIVQEDPGKFTKSPRTLSRPTDKVSADYKTTSSQINSVVGGISPQSFHTCGIPTIRSDIPVPRYRRVSDRTDYGDLGNAYSLIHPSIFSEKGVFEKDFFKARSKEEIARILQNIGVNLTDENFEHVWNLASQKHHKGEVCVESVRNVLDEMQHATRIRRNQV